MKPIDYRPQWYEDAQPEAAHAASEIQDKEAPPPSFPTAAEIYAIAAIVCLIVAAVVSAVLIVRMS